ncbi:hypothetical protein TNCV_1078301, partial [Trichonephila clavipes]
SLQLHYLVDHNTWKKLEVARILEKSTHPCYRVPTCWRARSPDLSLIKRGWNIIGRQRQSHPQPELSNLIWTDQE